MTYKQFRELTGIKITENHTGKMEGMQSLSTSCTTNPFCKVRSKDDKSICSKCYAQRMMKMYRSLDDCLEVNTKVLTSKILKEEEIPDINVLYFRFEAFGDLINEIQLLNYFNICKKNPQTKFALWTKNPWIIERLIEQGYKKPRNLQIILSSIYLNVQEDVDKYDFVDKVFTVYTKDYIEENNIKINCGAKSCLKCHKCYIKSKTKYINEKVK